MKTINEILVALAGKGVHVSASHGKLKAAARKGMLDDEAIKLISSNRAELLTYLVERGDVTNTSAQSGPQSERLASDAGLPPRMEASQMQRVWWRWWQDSERHESLPFTVVFRNTSSVVVEKAIKDLVKRHAVLLSRFVEDHGELSVHINDPEKFEVDRLPKFYSAEEAIESFKEWRKTPIQHDSDWLVRAAGGVVQNEAIAALELSHLICDGNSFVLLEKDLRQMVALHEAGNTGKIERDFSFFEYAAAERKWYQSSEGSEIRSFWGARVDSSPLFSTPSGTPIGGRVSGPRTKFHITLSPTLVDEIFSVGKEIRTTPYVLFMAAYALALSDWTNCPKFYISSSYDLRSTPELLSTVGFLSTTRLTEITFDDTSNVREAINHIWQQEQFSRSMPLPPGAGDDPSIRNGVSAMLNYIPADRNSSQPPIEQSKDLLCVVDEPVITEPRPYGHPVSLLLRHMYNGGLGGVLDFGGDRISLDEMRSLGDLLKLRLIGLSRVIQDV